MPHIDKWKGRTALIVDDSRSQRSSMVEFLKDIDFMAIHEAEDGCVALRRLDELENVDFILTDLNMPVMDGIEFLSHLAKLNRKFFVAVMSSVSADVLETVQMIADASLLEILAVLPKPLRQTDILKILGTHDPSDRNQGAKVSAVATTQMEFTEAHVEAALLSKQLIPYFQPKVALADKKLKGFEALVRWRHPILGVIPPARFVHHLEQGDIALRFFFYFLDEICTIVNRLNLAEPGIHYSINMPAALLENVQLVDKLESILRSHALPNHLIVIEVTESSVMSNLAASLSTLARLRMKGFGIAMDDYGTGYSSIKQLSRCPFTELKIDKEFVTDVSNSTKKLAILNAAVALSHRLNLVCVAEGVETDTDWQQLASMGCDLAQGYYISRPFPADKLSAWVDTWDGAVI